MALLFLPLRPPLFFLESHMPNQPPTSSWYITLPRLFPISSFKFSFTNSFFSLSLPPLQSVFPALPLELCLFLRPRIFFFFLLKSRLSASQVAHLLSTPLALLSSASAGDAKASFFPPFYFFAKKYVRYCSPSLQRKGLPLSWCVSNR